MEFRDLEVGKTYVLRGQKQTRVRLLETPDDIRRTACVRVEYLTGIHAGESRDIPTRRIIAFWDGHRVVWPGPRRQLAKPRYPLLAHLPPPLRTMPKPERLPTRSEIYGPEHPTRLVDELMEAVSFSERCLAEYRRLFARKLKRADVPDELRREIRYRGELLAGDDPGRTRIRVRGRFDVLLPDPMPEDGHVVDRLYVPAKIRARAQKRAA